MPIDGVAIAEGSILIQGVGIETDGTEFGPNQVGIVSRLANPPLHAIAIFLQSVLSPGGGKDGRILFADIEAVVVGSAQDEGTYTVAAIGRSPEERILIDTSRIATLIKPLKSFGLERIIGYGDIQRVVYRLITLYT